MPNLYIRKLYLTFAKLIKLFLVQTMTIDRVKNVMSRMLLNIYYFHATQIILKKNLNKFKIL